MPCNSSIDLFAKYIKIIDYIYWGQSSLMQTENELSKWLPRIFSIHIFTAIVLRKFPHCYLDRMNLNLIVATGNFIRFTNLASCFLAKYYHQKFKCKFNLHLLFSGILFFYFFPFSPVTIYYFFTVSNVLRRTGFIILLRVK